MKEIIETLTDHYKSTFPDVDRYRLFFSPGRANLIGEHTDYTGGLVFPFGLDCGTYILAAPNDSGSINLLSMNFPGKPGILKYNNYTRCGEWYDYFAGVIDELDKSGILPPDKKGFNAIIYGNIPNGAGLSSSASLEMAAIVTLLGINGVSIPANDSSDMIRLTLTAQAAENNFIGLNCGIMDQFASGCARSDHAILLDCYDLSYKYAPLNLGDKYSILIANTNKQRMLSESKYNERRAECESGFAILKKNGATAKALGRVTTAEWDKYASHPEITPLIYRRLNHVITENERVRTAYNSLAADDIETFAACINASGSSLKNSYEVTGEHLDNLVWAALDTDGVICSRMTGAGFGGCTINIIEKNKIEDIKKSIAVKYSNATGLKPDFYIFKAGRGSSEIII